MPDLKWNKEYWDHSYQWPGRGEEWSVAWGGSYPQWISTIFPRISMFIPAPNILEIAPGFGRWSRFLISMSSQYKGVDLAESCVEYCKTIFKDCGHADFFQNDGRSLEMIENDSVDFCFSLDSLVHAEMDVMEEYIAQIVLKLKEDGVAFLHHSNFEEYHKSGLKNWHSRATSVSAEKVMQLVEKSQGRIMIQERINWGEAPQNLNDCFTVFCRKNSSKLLGEPKIINNHSFGEEIDYCKKVLSNYSTNLER